MQQPSLLLCIIVFAALIFWLVFFYQNSLKTAAKRVAFCNAFLKALPFIPVGLQAIFLLVIIVTHIFSTSNIFYQSFQFFSSNSPTNFNIFVSIFMLLLNVYILSINLYLAKTPTAINNKIVKFLYCLFITIISSVVLKTVFISSFLQTIASTPLSEYDAQIGPSCIILLVLLLCCFCKFKFDKAGWAILKKYLLLATFLLIPYFFVAFFVALFFMFNV